MGVTKQAKKTRPVIGNRSPSMSGDKERGPEVAGFQIKDQDLIERIDRFIKAQPIPPTRTAVFLYALEFMLSHYGFGRGGDEAASPAEKG
jgi:hypothetical protein